MFPGYSRQFYRPNQQVISRALEKSRKNELTVEEILDDEDLINDLKSQSFSQLVSCINQEKLHKLIDYITIEPPNENDQKSSFKFPYFSSEILTSENAFIIDKFFEEDEGSECEKNSDIQKDEIKLMNRGSSVIEININDDIINDSEIKEKKNNSDENNNEYSNKDNKLFDFLNSEDKEVDITDKKTNLENQINSKEIVNIISEINVNLTGENKENVNNNEEKKVNQSDENLIDTSNEKIVKTVEKTKTYSNLDYLFRFLTKEGPLNYVLCGYFHKIFNHLSNYKNAYLMRYLLETRQDVIFNIIDHLDRKSICDVMLKILISYIPDFNDHDIKKEIITRIIKTFNPNNLESSTCVSDFFTEILSNKRIYYLVIKNEDLLINLHQLIINNIDNKIVNKDLLRILIKFNENLLKDVNGIATTTSTASNSDSQNMFSNYILNNFSSSNEEENFLMKSHSNDNFDLCNFSYVFITLSNTVDVIGNDFSNDTHNEFLNNTFSNQKQKVLGLRKLVEFEYIKDIIEIIINANSNLSLSQNINLINLTNKLVSTNVFKKMIQYFFEYALNNMYHKLFNDVILLIVNKYTPEIIINIFSEEDFLTKLIDSSFDQTKHLELSLGRKINSSVFAIVCEMSVILSESDNAFIKNMINKNAKWNEYIIKFAMQIKEKYKKGIQFTDESPFQKQGTMDRKISIDSVEKNVSETHKELIAKCTYNLSFTNIEFKQEMDKKRIMMEKQEKTTFDLITNLFENETYETEESSYYDNNYWKSIEKDFDFLDIE